MRQAPSRRPWKKRKTKTTICWPFLAENDTKLIKKVLPFQKLLQTDTFGYPIIVPKGSVYVGAGDDRRSTGTHYTPRKFTEHIVKARSGPHCLSAGERQRGQASGAGSNTETQSGGHRYGKWGFFGPGLSLSGSPTAGILEEYGAPKEKRPIRNSAQPSKGVTDEEFIAENEEERRLQAMRTIAERCLYGVDKNPMAVEMAKLSLWLETVQKGKPFTFLDHALKCGDSLLGIHQDYLSQNREDTLFQKAIFQKLDEAAVIRLKMEQLHAESMVDIHEKERLLASSNELTSLIGEAAKHVTTRVFEGEKDSDKLLEEASTIVARKELNPHRGTNHTVAGHRTFIWFAEFPEVFAEGGFDAIVGNPPFMGGKKISGRFSTEYRNFLLAYLRLDKQDMLIYVPISFFGPVHS